MYAEGGWKPASEPPARRPRLTGRQERILMWLIAINVVLTLVAPIGGATILQAVAALLGHG